MKSEENVKIIDCHAHVSAPAELWAYKASLLSHRGAHGRGGLKFSDDEIRNAVNEDEQRKTRLKAIEEEERTRIRAKLEEEERAKRAQDGKQN